MSMYNFDYGPMYPQKGTEAGGGGTFSAMRICSQGGQSQQQVEPKQPPAPPVQGGIPIGFPQQNRPGSIYQTRPAATRIQQRPHMLGGIPTNLPYASPMLLHTPPPHFNSVIIPQHSTIQPGRHQSHGGGQGGGSGGAPQAYYPSSQQQLFTVPSHMSYPQYATANTYALYPHQMRNSSYAPPNSGPHPGAPSQPPPQQQPQQFVVDPNVGGSGAGGGSGGGNAPMIMQHAGGPPQQAQPQLRRRPNALPITDPNTGRNIMEDLFQENQSESGDSGSSVTPQSTQNGQVAAEFAARVAAVAADGEIPGSGSSGISGAVNGPSSPPPSQLPPPPTPPVSTIEVNLSPSVHPPPSPAAPQGQRSSDHGPSPQPQPQPQLPQPQQCLSQAPVIQTPTVQPHHPAAPSHPQHHVQHHQQPQIPPQQIPTVSAKTDSPTVELPRPKAPTTAHSPGRKSTPVPPVQPPILDQKKKEKKVAGLGNTLTTHREEPEEVKKSSFADAINIKNLQAPPAQTAVQLPPQPAPPAPIEAETNGEPELPPPSSTPAPQSSQTAAKHNERQEQHQTQHERGGKALQRQKQKKKSNMKELNRRGQEKEGGTDMDAFTTTTPAEVSPPSPPPSSSPGSTPAAASAPPVQPVTSQPEPAVVEASPPQAAPLSNQAVPEPRQPSPAPVQQSIPPPAQPKPEAPVSQTIIPPSNKNVDNEQDEGLEDMDEDEEVDEDSLLVAKKNEENAKVSLAPAAELEERIVIETTVIERSKAPSLKYTYKEGQWSPLNPEGKKVYDREFLLNLRTDDLSTKRPDIDDCDIIKTDSTNNNSISATNNNRRTLHGSNSMSMNRGDGFAPMFMRSSSSQRGGGMAYSKRGSQQGRPGGGGGGGRSKGMYPSSQYKPETEEELHWASKGGGWKPERCKTPPKLTEEEVKTESLYKRVRGILNKLTPQKFEKLMEQINELPIDTHERLKGVVELVFDKAVDEPSFSRAYAKLCQNLGKLVIRETTESNDSTSFRKILLTRCQQMFEKKKKEEMGEEGKKSDDERIAELQKQVASEDNKEKKKELQLILEEEERKIRVKYVGLARFIGELFKLNMLTANIMHGCIKTLLEKIEEESLECLCKLLTTVGKELEVQSAKENKDLEEYFAKMRKLSQKSANSKVSSRVRFMLQDVIELRSNKWVPRRDENNPKTMEQIQKDAERETMMESALLQSSTPRSKHSDRDDRRRGGARGGGNNNPQDPDGWHVSTNKFRSYAFEPAKLQHLKGMDTEPVGGLSLGSYGQFSQWNSGSNAKRSGGEPKRPEYSNKYALLGTDDKTVKMAPPMMSRKATPSSSLEKERAVQGVREVLGDRVNRGQSSNPPSRDSSRVRSKPTTPQTPTPVAEPEQPVPREIPPMSTEAALKKSRELFEEWILNRNVQETVDSIKESFAVPMDFVKPVMDTVLEGKPFQRVAFGELLAALLAKNVVSPSDVCKGLSECIEIGEDLMIDLPFVWTYLAEFLVPILSKGVFTFADLKVACEPCRTPYLSKTLVEIISQMLKSKGPGFIRTQWESSKVKFSDFIPESDVDDFIKKNNFGFLIGEGEIEASEPVLPMNEVENILYDFLIQDGEKTIDHVCEWVKANVGAKSQDVDFIRSLTRAVIKACIKNEKIVPGSLNKHSNLIKKFVDTNETRELACLSGIQHLIVVQMMSPAGVLVEIFQTLYENGIISHEAFIKWRTSKNEEGKGVAIASLSSFFVSLSEQDESDDEST